MAVRLLMSVIKTVKNLTDAFEHDNEWHQHHVLWYRSSRKYLRRQTNSGLRDKVNENIGPIYYIQYY